MRTSNPRKNRTITDPTMLLATVMEALNVKNDAALSRALEINPPVISKIRNKRVPMNAALMIRIHEETGISIKEIKTLLDPAYKPQRPLGHRSDSGFAGDGARAG